ncbi:tRNA-dihydrouridine synthase [Candidatus Dojkabacteria bacterium]|nr:tRNA-dihydrouridine synthase [Candidatus Dojkabacteria bacterium]
MNFWNKLLEKPLVGLSPMDGVTDAPYRYIQKKYGNPDVIITEFVSVDGILHGGERLFQSLIYDESERPVVAQISGKTPELFFKAAHIICELGFDGIDINMGCPANNVSRHGGGASLINTPDLAKRIVKAAKDGVKSWVESGLEFAEVNRKVETIIKCMKKKLTLNRKQQDLNQAGKEEIPVSVKTRIGYDKKNAVEWIKHLTEVEPAVITLHGRTLKEMYKGEADWDEIARAVQSTNIPVIGNGDIRSSNDAVERIKSSRVVGVLIGRASYGNPWIFKNKVKIKKFDANIEDYEPTLEEKIQVVLEHARKHLEIKGSNGFIQMRKNLAWYFKGFHNAAELRNQLVKVNNLSEVEAVLNKLI